MGDIGVAPAHGLKPLLAHPAGMSQAAAWGEWRFRYGVAAGECSAAVSSSAVGGIPAAC